MKFLLITIIASLLSFSVGAEPNNKQPSETATQPPAATIIDAAPQSSMRPGQLDEATMYKLLYKNASSANDRIISTMHWAIGLVSTFILAIFGSQIFFNYRINKEEIEAIRR